jgi:hypothetical protein
LEVVNNLLKLKAVTPVEKSKYSMGDILVEDRSHYIGTLDEDPSDKEYPIVTLVIQAVHLDKGLYLMYNDTRDVQTIGYIALVDNADTIKKEKL